MEVQDADQIHDRMVSLVQKASDVDMLQRYSFDDSV
jgi:hypothetical protein